MCILFLFLMYCKAVDDKLKILGSERVGYLSIHLDEFRLKATDPDREKFSPAIFRLELQVQMLAQNLWSEMSHDSVYKTDDSIRKLEEDLNRRVNLMAVELSLQLIQKFAPLYSGK